jgi:hypothetical protein
MCEKRKKESEKIIFIFRVEKRNKKGTKKKKRKNKEKNRL